MGGHGTSTTSPAHTHMAVVTPARRGVGKTGPRKPKGAVPPGLTSAARREGGTLRRPEASGENRAPRAEGRGAAWTDARSEEGRRQLKAPGGEWGKQGPASRRARCRLD